MLYCTSTKQSYIPVKGSYCKAHWTDAKIILIAILKWVSNLKSFTEDYCESSPKFCSKCSQYKSTWSPQGSSGNMSRSVLMSFLTVTWPFPLSLVYFLLSFIVMYKAYLAELQEGTGRDPRQPVSTGGSEVVTQQRHCVPAVCCSNARSPPSGRQILSLTLNVSTVPAHPYFDGRDNTSSSEPENVKLPYRS